MRVGVRCGLIGHVEKVAKCRNDNQTDEEETRRKRSGTERHRELLSVEK